MLEVLGQLPVDDDDDNNDNDEEKSQLNPNIASFCLEL